MDPQRESCTFNLLSVLEDPSQVGSSHDQIRTTYGTQKLSIDSKASYANPRYKETYIIGIPKILYLFPSVAKIKSAGLAKG